MISLQDWLLFLKRTGTASGFPLVVCGLGLMFFGWRMWKVCVILCYGLIGVGLARWWLGTGPETDLATLGIGGLLAWLSYWPLNYTVSFLGGLGSAGLTYLYVTNLGFAGAVVGGAAVAAFIMGTAFAYLNRQNVVILATAVLGAILLVSGLTSWVMAWPQLYGALRELALGTVVVVPFLLSVPTITSCLYQIGEVRRLEVDS